ncbi:MAG: DNA repair protein Rad52 [Thermaceae bacterium]|nr:DNA repair protein Rad52 [Thermaceae bacterium]
METINILTAPLTSDEIEWKIISSKNGSTTLAPYIDARAVMTRLDRAFGPFGWQVRYAPAQVGNEHGVIAGITVKHPETGEWVEKQDGSGASDMEPFKGGISGALKRAATVWGIGRELYTYPRVIVEGEHRYIPWKVLERLRGLPKAVSEGKPLPEVIRLNPDWESVRKGGSISPEAVCKGA